MCAPSLCVGRIRLSVHARTSRDVPEETAQLGPTDRAVHLAWSNSPCSCNAFFRPSYHRYNGDVMTNILLHESDYQIWRFMCVNDSCLYQNLMITMAALILMPSLTNSNNVGHGHTGHHHTGDSNTGDSHTGHNYIGHSHTGHHHTGRIHTGNNYMSIPNSDDHYGCINSNA